MSAERSRAGAIYKNKFKSQSGFSRPQNRTQTYPNMTRKSSHAESATGHIMWINLNCFLMMGSGTKIKITVIFVVAFIQFAASQRSEREIKLAHTFSPCKKRSKKKNEDY